MLGVVDWGIGGLGIVRHLIVDGKSPPILYLSDTGAPPYGTLPRNALAMRLQKVVAFLRARGADHVLFACNAASTTLPRNPIENVSGVIDPTIELMAKLPSRSRVAVIGGRRTILSRIYQQALVARGFRVIARVAQPLSAIIERGERESPEFAVAAKRVLRGTESADTLLLACTHYPAAMNVFARLFKGRVVDPLDAIARAVPVGTQSGAGEFLTTGEPKAMERAAVGAWGGIFKNLRASRVRIY
jgi:glutamate racemase